MGRRRRRRKAHLGSIDGELDLLVANSRPELDGLKSDGLLGVSHSEDGELIGKERSPDQHFCGLWATGEERKEEREEEERLTQKSACSM